MTVAAAYRVKTPTTPRSRRAFPGGGAIPGGRVQPRRWPPRQAIGGRRLVGLRRVRRARLRRPPKAEVGASWVRQNRPLNPRSLDLVDHELVGDVEGAVAGVGGAAAELGDAAGEAFELAAAAAVGDLAGGVEALAVPGAGGGVGEGAAAAGHVAGDVEDAPTALVAAVERLDDVDGAAVERAALELHLIGHLDAVRRLASGLLADAVVEGDVGAQPLRRGRRGGRQHDDRCGADDEISLEHPNSPSSAARLSGAATQAGRSAGRFLPLAAPSSR